MTTFDTGQTPAEQGNPYLSKGPTDPLLFEEFEGINTSTSRYGVDDKQMWWCDGWMPIGPKLLRTLPGVGTPIWTQSGIVFFDFANILTAPIMIGVVNDGSIWQVNTRTKVVTSIAPAGTIRDPSRDGVGISQWGNKYVLIVANQTNGYFIWDGTNFYQSGSLGPPVNINNGGAGYTNPTVTASGGSGSGATFKPTVAGGIITEIDIVNPGKGYLATDTITLTITDSTGTGAVAHVKVMPFGIQGTALETYAGRVWIANGATITFSAPGSFVDFTTANGGGNFTSSDSFLRVRYTQLKQTNGFLYLIGDSSINYISGVQTAGVPPTTTFTNQNADPETGTIWPATVDVFGRNIVFANAFGAQISYGAAVTKISEPLDGVYASVPNFAGLSPSAAKSIIYGKKVWMLLLPIIDPVTNAQVNKLFLWNGKIWWASNQDVSLNYIQHQEIDSVLTAYGTDGNNVYPLFSQASQAFTKVVQSKLWARPGGYQFVKSTERLWALFYFIKNSQITVNISVDNELSSNTNVKTYQSVLSTILTKNASGTVIPVKNASGTTIPVISVKDGIFPIGPTAVGQNGILEGLTISTNEGDIQLWSAMISPKIASTLE